MPSEVVAPAIIDSLVRGRARLDLRCDAADEPMHLVLSHGSRTGWTQLAAGRTGLTSTMPVEQRAVALDALMDALHPTITATSTRPAHRVHPALAAAVRVAARVAADLPHPDALAAVQAAVHAVQQEP